MKTQEAFDRVVTHLANQKTISVQGQVGVCLYRGSEDRMCAIGCLLSNKLAIKLDKEHRGKAIDNEKTWSLAKDELDLKDLDDGAERMFYAALQKAHDRKLSRESLHLELKSIAQYFELDPEKIELITEWDPYAN